MRIAKFGLPRLISLWIIASYLFAGGEPMDWERFPMVRTIVAEKESVIFIARAPNDQREEKPFLTATFRKDNKSWTYGVMERANIPQKPPVPNYNKIDYSSEQGAKIPIKDGVYLIVTITGKRDLYAEEDNDYTGHYVLSETAIEIDGQQYFFRPAMTPEETRKYSLQVKYGVDARGVEKLPIATELGPYDFWNDKIYFVMNGGFSEGFGGIGGLAMFDLKEKKWEIRYHPLLGSHSSNAVLLQKDTLWIAPVHHGVYGDSASVSLIRHNLKTGEWQSFRPEDAKWEPDKSSYIWQTTERCGISGDIVWEMELDGDVLWLATNYGISQFDTKENKWQSWYWHEDVESEFIYSLDNKKTEALPYKMALLDIMKSMGVINKQAFLQAAKTLNPDDFKDSDNLVAHPAFRPFVREALTNQDPAIRSNAIRVLHKDPSEHTHLMSLLLSLEESSYEVASIATTLYKAGNEEGMKELIRRLEECDSAACYNKIGSHYISAFGATRYAPANAIIKKILATRHIYTSIKQVSVGALWQIGGEENYSLLLPYLYDKDVRHSMINELAYGNISVPPTHKNETVLALRKLILEDLYPSFRFLVCRALINFGDVTAIPVLIDLLNTTKDRYMWYSVHTELIRATGTDLDLGRSTEITSETAPQYHAKWKKWWEENKENFKILSPEEGDEAFGNWVRKTYKDGDEEEPTEAGEEIQMQAQNTKPASSETPHGHIRKPISYTIILGLFALALAVVLVFLYRRRRGGSKVEK